jgi:hypothetical protein
VNETTAALEDIENQLTEKNQALGEKPTEDELTQLNTDAKLQATAAALHLQSGQCFDDQRDILVCHVCYSEVCF